MTFLYNQLLASSGVLAQSGIDSSTAAGGIGGLAFLCCFGIVGIALFGFWIWMLIDCCTKTFPGSNDKLIWILVIVLTGWIGALIYYFVARSKGTKS